MGNALVRLAEAAGYAPTPYPRSRAVQLATSALQTVGSAFGFTPQLYDLASPYSDPGALVRQDLADLFGVADAFGRLDRAAALKISTVSKARDVITGTVGRLPLYDVKNGVRNTYSRTLLTQPSPAVPLSTMLSWTVDQLIFYPAAYWIVRARLASGWPAEAELVRREWMELDRAGNLARYAGQPVNPVDVIRFDSPSSGLLEKGERTLKRALAIELAAAKAEDNPVPSFELHNDGDQLDADKALEMVRLWVESRRKYGVAYTSKGIKTQAWGLAPEQLLIDGRKRVDLELIRHMSVPAWVADVPVEGASLTYNNRESRNWELIDLACAPYMSAVADRLSMIDCTPAGWRVRFDTDELTKPDMKTRFETYEIGKRAGFLTDDRIAEWEGWAPIALPAGNEDGTVSR